MQLQLKQKQLKVKSLFFQKMKSVETEIMKLVLSGKTSNLKKAMSLSIEGQLNFKAVHPVTKKTEFMLMAENFSNTMFSSVLELIPEEYMDKYSKHVDYWDHQDIDGCTLLHIMIKNNVGFAEIKRIINVGVDLSYVTAKGNTVLSVACMNIALGSNYKTVVNRNIRIVKLLLKTKRDIFASAVNIDNKTAEMIAREAGNSELADMIAARVAK